MNKSIGRFAGFGLGLRKEHHARFLEADQPVDFVEIISENFMACGGQPLRTLDAVTERYPTAMHGVAMSLGSSAGLDSNYLAELKMLAHRVKPLWLSDHLCWTGAGGRGSHDLLPLPYDDEALDVCIANVTHAQDVLERPLLIENPSSYVSFAQNTMSEWQFLAALTQETGCYLLLDVNNVYVSSVNHGFDALAFLDGIPADRVRQIHLAGHSSGPQGLLIDTHDAPVCPKVWALYQAATARFGPCATMIERDDAIPQLEDLLAELSIARSHAGIKGLAA
ncbi:DUF692 domain-containing protein [Novosphingobium sp.]|uniref:MNIO family bufferin maturase n=1 Tax=Novosphingobium sp. TaxID=1874826 RepID=UPI0025FB23A0|nr:DUF692 domain-containing protein [Novosphingobium sp.]